MLIHHLDQMVHSNLDLFLLLFAKVSHIFHQFPLCFSYLWLTHLITDKDLVYKDLYWGAYSPSSATLALSIYLPLILIVRVPWGLSAESQVGWIRSPISTSLSPLVSPCILCTITEEQGYTLNCLSPQNRAATSIWSRSCAITRKNTKVIYLRASNLVT